ncbi:MAG: chemotaxis protein CheW [Pirellulales bacterium]
MASSHEGPVWERLRARLNELSVPQTRQHDPTVLAERLKARAQVLRGRVGSAARGGMPLIFLAFHKGGERYGIPIDDVLEVQILEQFTPIPGTPPFIPGVVHWRGAILALLDLGKLFGIGETGIADTHAFIIVEAGQRRIALITGEVDEILSVPRDEVHPPPALLGGLPPEWVLGVHDENRMILRLNSILRDPRLEDWKA